jgi:predicted dehydrogenase
VAIIGAGQVGAQHVRAFSQLASDVRVLGVADIDEQRATELASTCDASVFTRYQELLELAPDIAVICLPHNLHLAAAVDAAQAGCHIVMEKPLAHTMADARAIVETCRSSGVMLTVSFVHRYRTEFLKAKELIASGQIGRPAVAIDNFCSQGGPHVPGWVWRKDESGGGPLMYGAIHSLDRLRWLLDSEVEEVFARCVTYSQNVDVEDGLLATLVFANGCLATLIVNSPGYVVTPRVWDTEVYGSEARIRVRTRKYLEYTSDSRSYRLDITRDDNFGAQAREFVAAIREGREPWITGEDGLRAQKVAMAIYRSAELKQPQRVNYE